MSEQNQTEHDAAPAELSEESLESVSGGTLPLLVIVAAAGLDYATGSHVTEFLAPESDPR